MRIRSGPPGIVTGFAEEFEQSEDVIRVLILVEQPLFSTCVGKTVEEKMK